MPSSYFEIRHSEFGPAVGHIDLTGLTGDWKEYSTQITQPAGVQPIYLVYHGECKVQLLEIRFYCNDCE